MVICQKWLTGHPKGAAAAWMLNGLLQVMMTGLVPGNRNADDIEPELAQNFHLVFPNHSIQTDGIDATLLKSFGFGQAGAEVLLIHPKFLFAAIGDNEPLMRKYRAQLAEREARSFHHQQEILAGRTTVVRVKDSPPYSKTHEESVYLDPDARASFDFSQDRFVIKPTKDVSPTASAEGSPADRASVGRDPAPVTAAGTASVDSDLSTKLEVAFRRRAEVRWIND